MTEKDAIGSAQQLPVTISSLVADFHKLGVKAGMTLLLHSSLSSLGWVCGGPIAVIKALQIVLTRKGNLVMPAHSGGLSDPGEWQNPPVPESWWKIIRDEMPAYDPQETPTLGIGIIPEIFRSCRDVVRSNHPATSFAAWGRDKDYIISKKTFPDGMGEDSPLDRVYELDGQVLLLGATYEANSSFHLAEYRADYSGRKRKDCFAPVLLHGKREWIRFNELDFSSDDFATIGAAMEKSVAVGTGLVGASQARLIAQRPMVDFAAAWMSQNRC